MFNIQSIQLQSIKPVKIKLFKLNLLLAFLSACNYQALPSEHDLFKNAADRGSCFYKVDLINKLSNAPLSKANTTKALNALMLSKEGESLGGIIGGNSWDGRVFLELTQPCADAFDGLAHLVAKLQAGEIGTRGDAIEVKHFGRSNAFEMNSGYPDNVHDFDAEKSYFPPLPGSCFYMLDVVAKETGHYADFTGVALNEIVDRVPSVKRAMRDEFREGRLVIEIAPPCDKSLEAVQSSVPDLIASGVLSGGAGIVVKFTQATGRQLQK